MHIADQMAVSVGLDQDSRQLLTLDYLYSDTEIEGASEENISIAGLDEDDVEEVERLIRHLRAKNRRYNDVPDEVKLRRILDKQNNNRQR